ncbi:TetR/AcrR family transcriptional regulator [Ponticoccus alexandrii]|uniref:TetR family transcriptional regulator n=1 Tax=Ponticoccus alexandrii TaxID=1943633 RepID=A0ABX7FBL0_9RHOB|nr:TetR/AcrR family transcriptional regulator [Ponticoccus alexandrii]ETA50504.1 hypothetical protein P279_19115 [Rhodobacteraceae bacterium PD-2]QRF67207.1 TetR family transcriptional regulator [Ponticoccus alexandrii]
MDGAPDSGDRRPAICAAAFTVFAQYGFRRTSMEDIARAAGMSRPALYQHFRNKEDLARHLVLLFFERAETDVRAALATQGPVDLVLTRAFAAKMGPLLDQMLSSPHGEELVEMSSTLSADIVAEGVARIEAVFADWLRAGAKAGWVALDGPPEAMAATILAALDGLKKRPLAEIPDHQARLARMMGRALTPSGTRGGP